MGDLDYPPATRYAPRNWTLLGQSQMGPRFVIVIEILCQRPLQMFGIQDHEVVQALSANGTDQTFGVRILPRAVGCGENFCGGQRRDPQTNVVAVDAVPIPDR
jgi:hypothetical protein